MPTPTTTPADRRGQTRFRAPEPADGQVMWALAERAGLDLNSPYAYVMWSDHHAGTSVIAVDDDGEVVGFTIGFLRADDQGTLFIWQVGVDERARGNGVGGRMLDELVARTGVTVVEATVTPTNVASTALFRGLASRHDSVVEEAVAYGEELFPAGHEAEILFRIPLSP